MSKCERCVFARFCKAEESCEDDCEDCLSEDEVVAL